MRVEVGKLTTLTWGFGLLGSVALPALVQSPAGLWLALGLVHLALGLTSVGPMALLADRLHPSHVSRGLGRCGPPSTWAGSAAHR